MNNLFAKARRIVACLSFFLSVSPVFAATINVDADCSLDNAIRSANDDAQVAPRNMCEQGASGADTIILSGDITLGATPPRVKSTITINGGNYTISGDNQYRVFSFTQSSSANLTINNLTLANGSSGTNSGGAMYVSSGATLAVNNSTIRNSSGNQAGAIHVDVGSTVTINKSTLHNNTANSGNGGAIGAYGNLTITNSTFYSNSASSSSGNGGAVYVDGSTSYTVSITNSTLHGNT